MVTQYGMSDKLGPLTLGQRQDQVFLGRDFASHPDYSDNIAFEVDKEIRRLVDEAHDEAFDILRTHRATMDNLVEILLDKETIEKEELLDLLAPVTKRAPRSTNGQRGTPQVLAPQTPAARKAARPRQAREK
jgi:cell division protease FtsH